MRRSPMRRFATRGRGGRERVGAAPLIVFGSGSRHVVVGATAAAASPRRNCVSWPARSIATPMPASSPAAGWPTIRRLDSLRHFAVARPSPTGTTKCWSRAARRRNRRGPVAAASCGRYGSRCLAGACTRAMLPAEGLTGRAFVLPARNVRPLSEPRRPPRSTVHGSQLPVPFDFDRSFVVYQLGDFLLDEAITWILAVKPARVSVVGHAATTPTLVSGRMLAERSAVARERAETDRRDDATNGRAGGTHRRLNGGSDPLRRPSPAPTG